MCHNQGSMFFKDDLCIPRTNNLMEDLTTVSKYTIKMEANLIVILVHSMEDPINETQRSFSSEEKGDDK